MRTSMTTLILLAVAGCGGSANDGYAVDLTIVADGSVDVAKVASITLSVTGAETFTSPVISVVGKFGAGRATLRYQPGVPSGTLNFAVAASSTSGGQVATGSVGGVVLKPGGTQKATITLSSPVAGDLGVADLAVADLANPPDAAVDAAMQQNPDLRPPVDLCVPKTVAECDDGNPCTVDTVSDGSCSNTCVHTPEATAIACTVAAGKGVCLGANCCTGCIHSGLCEPGKSANTLCGSGGSDCFDCTTDGATCSAAGACSGCTVASCTSASQTCGTSSCGFNCGACADSCLSGVITHSTCGGKSCAASGMTGCGNYATCHDGTTCKTDTNGGCAANGDSDCAATAYCNSGKKCVPRIPVGGPCPSEGVDDVCQAGLHCTWYSADGVQLGAVCAHATCTGCQAISASDWATCAAAPGIPVLLDPRSVCPKTDACHVGCGGANGGCNTGFDSNGNAMPCATTTCTPSTPTGSTGILSGSLCVLNGTTPTCVSTAAYYCAYDNQQQDTCCDCANGAQCVNVCTHSERCD